MKLSLWRHEQKFDEVIVRNVLMKVLGASSVNNRQYISMKKLQNSVHASSDKGFNLT